MPVLFDENQGKMQKITGKKLKNLPFGSKNREKVTSVS
jgi:hypothetical protein